MSILDSRNEEFSQALGELEAMVESAIDRLRPILSPYPTSMPPHSPDPSKQPPMSPLVNFIEDKTARVKALRHQIAEAMDNAQI